MSILPLAGARREAIRRIIHVLREKMVEACAIHEEQGIALPPPPFEGYYTVSSQVQDLLSNQSIACFVYPASPRSGEGIEGRRDRTGGQAGNVSLLTFDVDVIIVFRKGLYDTANPPKEGGTPLTHDEITFLRAERYVDAMLDVILTYAVDGVSISNLVFDSDFPQLLLTPEQGFMGLAGARFKVEQQAVIPRRKFSLSDPLV
jgi:hypothetical protein